MENTNENRIKRAIVKTCLGCIGWVKKTASKVSDIVKGANNDTDIDKESDKPLTQ